jgi:hypothetical protein
MKIVAVPHDKPTKPISNRRSDVNCLENATYNNYHNVIFRFCILMKMFQKGSGIIKFALKNRGAVYGSLLWRIFECMKFSHDNTMVLQKMQIKLEADGSDVDIVMMSSVLDSYKEEGYPFIHESSPNIRDYWLMYPVQNFYEAICYRKIQNIMQNPRCANCANCADCTSASSSANASSSESSSENASSSASSSANVSSASNDTNVDSSASSSANASSSARGSGGNTKVSTNCMPDIVSQIRKELVKSVEMVTFDVATKESNISVKIQDGVAHHTKHQVHFVEKVRGFRVCDAKEFLTKCAAPVLTPEALFYDKENGLNARLCPLNEVLSDLKNKQMRIINAKELNSYLQHRRVSLGVFKRRLMKYAAYGFELVVSANDLKFTFIARAVQALHTLHMDSVDNEQKNYICANRPYYIAMEMEEDEDANDQNEDDENHLVDVAIRNRDDAIAAHFLYMSYIASCVAAVTPFNKGIIDIVKSYAHRTNEHVFFKDFKVRRKIEDMEREIERLRAEIRGV